MDIKDIELEFAQRPHLRKHQIEWLIEQAKKVNKEVPANETSRIELLERDIYIMLQENWRLKSELEYKDNLIKVMRSQATAQEKRMGHLTSQLAKIAELQTTVQPLVIQSSAAVENQIKEYARRKRENILSNKTDGGR